MNSNEAAVKIVKAKLMELYEDDTIEGIEEYLTCEAKELWRSDYDKHRWYQAYECVVEVDGNFVKFYYATNTGDNSLEDAGFHFSLDTLRLVQRKERVEFYYE